MDAEITRTRTAFMKQFGEASIVCVGHECPTKVMQPLVDIAKTQNQSRCGQVASQSNHGNSMFAGAFTLNQSRAPSSDVRSIESFGDSSLEAEFGKPAIGDLVIGCMSDQLQARMPAVE